jgi:hypothetical protein
MKAASPSCAELGDVASPDRRLVAVRSAGSNGGPDARREQMELLAQELLRFPQRRPRPRLEAATRSSARPHERAAPPRQRQPVKSWPRCPRDDECRSRPKGRRRSRKSPKVCISTPSTLQRCDRPRRLPSFAANAGTSVCCTTRSQLAAAPRNERFAMPSITSRAPRRRSHPSQAAPRRAIASATKRKDSEQEIPFGRCRGCGPGSHNQYGSAVRGTVRS